MSDDKTITAEFRSPVAQLIFDLLDAVDKAIIDGVSKYRIQGIVHDVALDIADSTGHALPATDAQAMANPKVQRVADLLRVAINGRVHDSIEWHHEAVAALAALEADT